MAGYDVPNPPDGLMDRIKDRLAEHQQKKRSRRRQLAIVAAVILLFAIPASAYNIAREYRGFDSGVRTAIENQEGIKLAKSFRHEDWEITIEDAVWEENSLAVTYALKGNSYRLGALEIADGNDNKINQGYALNGGQDGGTIDFHNIDLGSIEGDLVWLKILTIMRNEFPPPIAASVQIKVTPAMKNREYEEINKELAVEQGTYLLKDVYFGRDDLRISYEFTPRAQYRELFSSDKRDLLQPSVEFKSGGQSYGYAVASMASGNDIFRGTLRFNDVPIEKLKDFQLYVIDNVVLVDWKVPVPIQNKASVPLKLAEVIELPEGTLTLTGMRQGTKSTAIDFSFEPAVGFENISSIWLNGYLRANGKYYHPHGFAFTDHTPGLSGTITFDPVCYDQVEELEFILGRIEYTYGTNDVSVTVLPSTVPQRLEAPGSSFIIDQMEHKDGKTVLHITFAKDNRWYYDADFRIKVPGAGSLRVIWESEMGFAQLIDEEELQEGLQRLQDLVGEYDGRLQYVDLGQYVIGKAIVVSGEYEEVEVKLSSLSTIRFSGESVKISIK